MAAMPLSFEHIAVAAHPKMPDAIQEAGKIAAFLQEKGIQTTHGPMNAPALVEGVQQGTFDLWIALGGDGTMLRSGHLCAPHGLPIVGINMGNVGFLTSINQDEWPQSLPSLLEGNYWLEPRMMLCTEQFRGSQSLGRWNVLNEAMIGRGYHMRPVKLITCVDGHHLTTYVADGLIASTPTGSTAYALAAGGPVLPPDLRNILLVPVAAHLSFDRPIVLAEGSSVTVVVQTDHSAALSLDGQPSVELLDGDRIEVHASEHTVHFVRFQDIGYFYRNITSRMNLNSQRGKPNE
jgi:NAD+ kinase